MRIFLYKIKLLDPLFYAREGLSESFTPPYLHATAVNLAAKSALNLDPRDQPLLVSDENGGRNTPRYHNSLVSIDFYFTPARLITPLRYQPEITKGETDGFLVMTGRSDQGKPLKAGTLNYLPPESEFEGYLITKKDYTWPRIMRLGTFRGKVKLILKQLDRMRAVKEKQTLSHPVDPLVTSVKRGIMINIFPYPIVDNVQSDHAIAGYLEQKRFPDIVAFPDEWELPTSEILQTGKKAVIV